MLDICCSTPQYRWIFIEQANSRIAVMTQQATNLSRGVIVVDEQNSLLGTADEAFSFLLIHHCLSLFYRQPVFVF